MYLNSYNFMIIMLVKTIDSDCYKSYNTFNDIPIDDLEYIWYLSCNNSNYTNIDFIINIPNLMELDASENKITNIPSHNSIQILDIHNNELVELPTLESAININASYNKISIIKDLNKIKTLNISNNLLQNIHLEPSLINLNCSYNNINKIIYDIKWDYNLEIIDCSYNRLNNINFMFILDNLHKIIYNNNMITYMAPHVNRILNDTNHIYKKRRHSININQQFKIHNILLKPPMEYDKVMNEINKCVYLEYNAKQQLIYYCDFDEPNYKIYITFKELLCSLWAIIKTHNYYYRFITNLNYIYKQPLPCRCQSCQLINLSNALDDIPLVYRNVF